MRRAVVYQRKKFIFVRTVSRTVDGVWIESGPCTKMPDTVEVAALGEAILAHLSTSAIDVPHPTDWKLVQQPLLVAAEVKGWNSFGMMARSVGVKAEENWIRLEPRKNNKPGFVAIEGSEIVLEAQPGALILGEALKAAIAAST